MSRSSATKKARRKKRVAARGDRWEPRGVSIDDLLTERGWEFDEEFSSDDFASWYYPPSGIDTDDESVEAVTRVWLSDPAQPHVILVGTTEADGVDYQLALEDLEDGLDEIEAYRAGDPLPR